MKQAEYFKSYFNKTYKWLPLMGEWLKIPDREKPTLVLTGNDITMQFSTDQVSLNYKGHYVYKPYHPSPYRNNKDHDYVQEALSDMHILGEYLTQSGYSYYYSYNQQKELNQ